MGACDFENVGRGKDPQKVFDQLVSDSQYESGHSYSGEIGMKSDFVLVDLPPRMTTEDARSLWNLDDNLRFAKEHLTRLRKAEVESGYFRPPWQSEETREQVRERMLKEAQARVRKLQALGKKHRGLSVRITQIAEDKWGDCVCVEMKGAEAKRMRERFRNCPRGTRFFLFFGMASS